MAQHVWMSVRQACSFSRCLDHLADVRSGHWPATLRRKHKSSRPTALYLAQSSEFIALDWVNASNATLQSPDVEVRPGEVDLIPLKVNCFTERASRGAPLAARALRHVGHSGPYAQR